MLDRDIIQGRGFRNVADGSAITGFQFDLRNPNYRGTSASLLEGVDVIIDGELIPKHVPLWSLQGKTYTLDELRSSTGVRWQLDETATITVPKPGGLSAGLHDLEVTAYLRRPYFPPHISTSPFSASAKGVIVPSSGQGKLRYGVSTYSYSGDIYTSMTMEDAFADIADMGATGIEILGEANLPGYPDVTSDWVDNWHRLLDRYGLTPTNYGAWVDTEMWKTRSLSAAEAAAQLEVDLKMAKRLGFTSIRPKFGVTSWDLDPHPVWSEAVQRSLDLAQELDIVICPEIHAPTPINHPVTQGYLDFIEETGTKHFKLLIDTGIFQTAPVDDGHEGFEEGKKRPAHLEALAVPMTDLVAVLPHVHFIQSKFFEIDDQLNDLHIPWQEIISTLVDTGWEGWLSSEYEGRREPYRGRDQVRRQHALLRQLEMAKTKASNPPVPQQQ
ncbi:C-glycoside deglycosidase beta subunit domain-containing protein [Pseudarthrobacter sp. YAF2]|uniref:C-glycoside deglycosidase beta subunit domain-containing protein n=1 Tax=Pseudarthrobacter sp. YAF2 TaxID=3233078 RepID=UPI003F990E7E